MEKLKPIEHKFKAFFFGFFKIFLRKGIKEFKPIDGSSVKKVLFLRPEKIGDMVISLPVFDGLKKHFPHIKISILGSPRNLTLIKDDPRFDKIYLYKKRPWLDLKELFAMRKGKYDCVIDMIGDDSVTALFLAHMTARGKPLIGIGKTKHREYYDYNYAYRTNNTNHVIENTLKLLDAFAIDSSKLSGYADPYLKPTDMETAENFIGGLRSNGCNGRLIGYNLSAGARTRIWAEEKSVELLNRIQSENSDNKIVLFTMPDERQRAESIMSKLDQPASLIPDNLSLKQVSAIIKKIDLMITPDTSIVHIARAYRVPVVGLYSRAMKNYMLWRPFDQEVGAVVAQSEDNIFDITVDQVFDTFKKVTEINGEVTK